MKLKLFTAFLLGFAAGMVTLVVALLAGGRLNGPVAATAKQPEATETRGRAVAPAVRSPEPASPLAPTPTPAPALETGTPEKKAVLAMPIAGVDPSKLESNFAEERDGKAHEALDIMAPRGTPVMAADEGNVVKLFTSKPGGLTVYQFNDARDLCYYYAHLDRYAKGLKEGVLLRRGDVLGYVGSTGNAAPSAPHLHFAVMRLGPEKQWWKGAAIDPLPLLQGGH